MTIEITVLLSVLGVAVSVATFFIGRMTSVKKSGEQQGRLELKLEHMAEDIKEIKVQGRTNSEQYSGVRTDIEVLKRDIKRIDQLVGELRELFNNSRN